MPQQGQLVRVNGPKLVVLLPHCYLRLILSLSIGKLENA